MLRSQRARQNTLLKRKEDYAERKERTCQKFLKFNYSKSLQSINVKGMIVKCAEEHNFKEKATEEKQKLEQYVTEETTIIYSEPS